LGYRNAIEPYTTIVATIYPSVNSKTAIVKLLILSEASSFSGSAGEGVPLAGRMRSFA